MSKNKKLIEEALPNIELDEDTSYLAEDLDKLEILATFKNSSRVGYLKALRIECAKKMVLFFKILGNLRDSITNTSQR